MVPTGKGMSGSGKRDAASHFLWDKIEKEFSIKQKGLLRWLNHIPLYGPDCARRKLCRGNCPGCSMWPGWGKGPPPEHWGPEAGASGNKSSLFLVHFSYLFLDWVLWIFLFFF